MKRILGLVMVLGLAGALIGMAQEAKLASAPDPKSSNDESLTLDEYIRLGLPAYDRLWSGDDMVKAEKVLTSVSQKGYRQLPRYKSRLSQVL